MAQDSDVSGQQMMSMHHFGATLPTLFTTFVPFFGAMIKVDILYINTHKATPMFHNNTKNIQTSISFQQLTASANFFFYQKTINKTQRTL